MFSFFFRLLTSPFRAHRLEEENRQLKEELQSALDLVLKDTVTGAMSRHALHLELARLGVDVQAANPHNRRHRRSGLSVAILVLDLSGFKSVNDQFGHRVGDQALTAVVDAIQRSIRTKHLLHDMDHLVFRVGGDEFVVLLEDVNCTEATIVAKRIIANIEAIPVWRLTGRIGGAVWDVNAHPNTKPIDVFTCADMLERELRGRGQNGVVDVQNYEP